MAEHDFSKRLSVYEVCLAAVFGDLALIFQIIGWIFTPLAALQWISAAFFAMLRSLSRTRAVVFSTMSVAAIGFLVGGVVLAIQICLAAVIGNALATVLYKRRFLLRSLLKVVFFGILPVDAVTDALLAIFSRARSVLLKQVLVAWRGAGNFIASLGSGLVRLSRKHGFLYSLGHSLSSAGHGLEHPAKWFVSHWYVTIPAANSLGIFIVSLLSLLALRPLLRAFVREQAGRVPPIFYRLAVSGQEGPPRPVPLELREVSFSYDGSPVFENLSLQVLPGKVTGVIGPNGAGKSTLAAIVAGADPTSGTVRRPGAVGIGKEGGTALILQRPESQILGARVIDDVVFGLDEADQDRARAVLNAVGLGGLEDRETFGLSGGQLQRLAIAAALMRRPSLLISDESTAMLDSAGREEVMGLFSSLARGGAAVFHVTHVKEDRRYLESVTELKGGDTGHFESGTGYIWSFMRGVSRGTVLIELKDVGHVWNAGTPWANRAIEGINLTLKAGELVLLVGENGAGKTTLGLIAAGLVQPTEGSVEGPAVETDEDGGEIKTFYLFQHARLQLTRRRVRDNLKWSLQPLDELKVQGALRSVGLDPARFADRFVETLSGGELRRVALASLLVSPALAAVIDEPLAGLDDGSRSAVSALLGVLKELNLSMLVITHDLEPLVEKADRVFRMENGRIREVTLEVKENAHRDEAAL